MTTNENQDMHEWSGGCYKYEVSQVGTQFGHRDSEGKVKERQLGL